MFPDAGSPSRRELRTFGLGLGGMVAGMFGLVLPGVFGGGLSLWPWMAGGVLCLWALVWPAGLSPVHQIWMRLAQVLGWLNTRIILGVVFLLLFVPVGVALRLLRKDPMARRWDAAAGTYRVASQDRPRDHFERPY